MVNTAGRPPFLRRAAWPLEGAEGDGGGGRGHALVLCLVYMANTASRRHALVGCYGHHRSPVARSNLGVMADTTGNARAALARHRCARLHCLHYSLSVRSFRRAEPGAAAAATG